MIMSGLMPRILTSMGKCTPLMSTDDRRFDEGRSCWFVHTDWGGDSSDVDHDGSSYEGEPKMYAQNEVWLPESNASFGYYFLLDD